MVFTGKFLLQVKTTSSTRQGSSHDTLPTSSPPFSTTPSSSSTTSSPPSSLKPSRRSGPRLHRVSLTSNQSNPPSTSSLPADPRLCSTLTPSPHVLPRPRSSSIPTNTCRSPSSTSNPRTTTRRGFPLMSLGSRGSRMDRPSRSLRFRVSYRTLLSASKTLKMRRVVRRRAM